MHGKALENIKEVNTRVSEIEKIIDKSKVDIDKLILELKEAKKDKEQIEGKYTIFLEKYKVLLKERKRKEKD